MRKMVALLSLAALASCAAQKGTPPAHDPTAGKGASANTDPENAFGDLTCPANNTFRRNGIVWTSSDDSEISVDLNCTYCSELEWEVEGGEVEIPISQLQFSHVGDGNFATVVFTLSTEALDLPTLMEKISSVLDDDPETDLTWAPPVPGKADFLERRARDQKFNRYQIIVARPPRMEPIYALSQTTATGWPKEIPGVTSPESEARTIMNTLKCVVED